MRHVPGVLFLLLLQLFAFQSFACSRKPGSPEPTTSELFQQAKSVFVAHVYRTEEKSWPLGHDKTPSTIVEADFSVIEALKGMPPTDGKVRDFVFGPGNCSVGLMAGFDYVFFIHDGNELVLWPGGSRALMSIDSPGAKNYLESLRNLPNKAEKAMKTHLRKIISILTLLTSAGLSAADPSNQGLPNDVSNIDKDMKAFTSLYETLQKTPPNDYHALMWLDKNSPLLPPIFLYEYSRRLNIAGQREPALRQLAKARLGRDLDSTECIRKDRNTPGDFWFTLTNQIESGILNSPKYDKDLWMKSISEAMVTESKRTKTSALWLCGENNTKDAELANASRNERYEYLRRDFEKMSTPK